MGSDPCVCPGGRCLPGGDSVMQLPARIPQCGTGAVSDLEVEQ